jgi:hypothetical protein
MSYHDVQPPDVLPILSPGKHRNPRKGACFMEFASLLAGERWSDHPACAHPLLAVVARHVNVQDAVEGIAQACVPDPDRMVRDLLVQAIDVCAAWVGRDRIAVGWSIARPSLTSGNVGDHLMSRVEEATNSDQGNTGPLHRRGRLADQVVAEGNAGFGRRRVAGMPRGQSAGLWYSARGWRRVR